MVGPSDLSLLDFEFPVLLSEIFPSASPDLVRFWSNVVAKLTLKNGSVFLVTKGFMVDLYLALAPLPSQRVSYFRVLTRLV